MERYDLYRDIAERTQGDIYIGVVGPVRTGKSTFIKKFMDTLVLPNIADDNNRRRIIDELPQSGAGRSIMTTQPSFVPNEAVDITIGDETQLSVRMVDCVGYMVKGATGHMEEGQPRMVRTPWFDYDIPFEEAAEIGTQKVIAEHSTIGVVMTCDGTVAEIPRSGYIEPEERVIAELKELNKPFVVVLNSATPTEENTIKLREAMEIKYNVPVLLLDITQINGADIQNLLETVLLEFPIRMVNFQMPQWISALSEDHWLVQEIMAGITESMGDLEHMRDYTNIQQQFVESENISSPKMNAIRLGEGVMEFSISLKKDMFYKILQEECGCEIQDEGHLFKTVKDLVRERDEYSRVANAIESVRQTGYGVVPPNMAELELAEPEIVRQGNRFGVRLKASAPSLHMIRVDVQTEVAPLVGTEKESEELVQYLLSEFENAPEKIWNTNIFGKSVNELVREGLSNKLSRMPDDVQEKLQDTLQKIINEGSGGLICILL
ncbi:MAG: stage IV sporulation protein A [Christensenellales bacterium]|jgi:stage IV sporulation protein A